jgi:hypothetical protein
LLVQCALPDNVALCADPTFTVSAAKPSQAARGVSLASAFDDDLIRAVSFTIFETDWKVLRRVHPLAHEWEIARIFKGPRRFNALTVHARMRAAGLLMGGEFAALSPETRCAVEFLSAR